jgi:hypothetical protein
MLYLHRSCIVHHEKTGKSSVFSKETSDALMQAQVMASQLTDRAGRAFRRAIKETNGGDAYNNGAGESSNDDDDVDSSDEYVSADSWI